jgi:hypothetical protein
MELMDVPVSFPRLRRVLRANAAFSATGGLAALVAFAPLDDLLGVDNRALVAVTGAGLVAFAVVVLAIARTEPGRLLRGAVVVSIADLAWVAATIVLVVTAELAVRGVAVLVVVAGVVAGFAFQQLRLRSVANGGATLGSPLPTHGIGGAGR